MSVSLSKGQGVSLKKNEYDLSSVTIGLGWDINEEKKGLNRPGFPGECFICELRLPDHRFRWKHNKLFLLL
ncbi:TerD family protein, partial [Escherichia coli]|uniref:TerD family protein n=1 Tax=Escherichia coli TaxID=562 RepID=UPI002032F600